MMLLVYLFSAVSLLLAVAALFLRKKSENELYPLACFVGAFVSGVVAAGLWHSLPSSVSLPVAQIQKHQSPKNPLPSPQFVASIPGSADSLDGHVREAGSILTRGFR